jgi:hypothetical protein
MIVILFVHLFIDACLSANMAATADAGTAPANDWL